MVILYKDPSGDGLKDSYTVNSTINQRRSSELKMSTIIQVKSDESSGLEEKITFLERKVSEQENTINKLKREMENKVRYIYSDSTCSSQ